MASRSVRCLFDNQTPYDLAKVKDSDQLDSGIYSDGWAAPDTIKAHGGAEWHCESDGFATGAVGSVTYQFAKIVPSQDPTKDDSSEVKTVVVRWDNPFVGPNSSDLSVTDDFTGVKSADVDVENKIEHGDLENILGTIAFPIMAFANSTSHPDATAVYAIRMKAQSGVTTDPNQTQLGAHAGDLIQSDYGLVGNYEMLVPQGQRLVHYARLNDPGPDQFRWIHVREVSFAGGAAGGSAGSALPARTPTAVSLLQTSFRGDGVHGNLDAVVRLNSVGHGLAFMALDSATNRWSAVTPILVDGQPITGVTGNPAMIQANWGAIGNYEMLVPQGQRLVHYARLNDPGPDQFRWIRVREVLFAGGAAGGSAGRALPASTPTAVSLLQTSFRGDGVHGNLDAVVRLNSVGGDRLAFMGLDSARNTWSAVTPILVDGQPITDINDL